MRLRAARAHETDQREGRPRRAKGILGLLVCVLLMALPIGTALADSGTGVIDGTPHIASAAGKATLPALPSSALVGGNTPYVRNAGRPASAPATLALNDTGHLGLSLAAPNPEFEAYMKSRKKPVIAGAAGAGGLVPSPVDLSDLRASKSRIGPLVFPSTYDLRTLDRVTPVKDQNPYGTCWTFGTLGSLESCLMPGDEEDFSEDHMVVTTGYDTGGDPYDKGGGLTESTAYLARWKGPVYETDEPYGAASEPAGLQARRHVQDVSFVPKRTGALDNDAIKGIVTDYGACAVDIKWDDASYKESNASYYYSGAYSHNHQILIVGWDDNYPAANFASTPPGNGAFIVKNSWGSGWGDGGYFHASYYDTTIGYGLNAVFDNAEQTSNYDQNYQYDILGWTAMAYVNYDSETAWFRNRFTATKPLKVSAVSFYSAQSDAAYEVYVSGGTSPLAYNCSGTMPLAGYHTVRLDTPVSVNGGQQFNVAVKLTIAGAKTPIPLENRIADYTSAATATAGESFCSADGNNWTDITSVSGLENANVCLKAFTVPDGGGTSGKAYEEISGANRFETAVDASQHAFPSGTDWVIVATGRNWPDALGGAALAGAFNAPILLTEKYSLPDCVLDEIDRLGATKAIILGGPAAVDDAVGYQLLGMMGEGNVYRIGGADRYETADLIADSVMYNWQNPPDKIAFISTGLNYPDALSASPVSNAGRWPIVLTSRTAVTQSTISTLQKYGVTDVFIVGSPNAVPTAIGQQLITYFGSQHVWRVSGATRYDTASRMAAFSVDCGLQWDGVAIATGENFPDALAGGPLQGRAMSVMLLSRCQSLDGYTSQCLSAHASDIFSVRYLGSTAAVGSGVREGIRHVLED